MKGFVENIEDMTTENRSFRHVLYTGAHLQLVVMSLKAGQDIGDEVHPDRDQFFRIEKGKGKIVIDGKTQKIKADDAIVVPAGARHNLVNTGKKPLKLYTLYGPPNHLDQLVQATKSEAIASHEKFAGITTESKANGTARNLSAPLSLPK
ncbi:MAG: cupin domain-containing protein [Rhizobiaceae bacterium]